MSESRQPITIPLTVAGNTLLLRATRGHRLNIHTITYSNEDSSAKAVAVRLNQAGQERYRAKLAANNGNRQYQLNPPWKTPVNAALWGYLPAAASTIYVTIHYEEEMED
jgi:hypothetical protein